MPFPLELLCELFCYSSEKVHGKNCLIPVVLKNKYESTSPIVIVAATDTQVRNHSLKGQRGYTNLRVGAWAFPSQPNPKKEERRQVAEPYHSLSGVLP